MRRSTRARQAPKKLTFDSKKGAATERLVSHLRDSSSSSEDDDASDMADDLMVELDDPKTVMESKKSLQIQASKGRLAHDPDMSSGRILFGMGSYKSVILLSSSL